MNPAAANNTAAWFVLSFTLAMTWLTLVKELVLYQNDPVFWQKIVHRLAMQAYYPALLINFILIALLVFVFYRARRFSFLPVASGFFFLMNVVLFSANNIINLLQGRPLHGIHHGIGW